MILTQCLNQLKVGIFEYDRLHQRIDRSIIGEIRRALAKPFSGWTHPSQSEFMY